MTNQVQLCQKSVASRSKFAPNGGHKCHCILGHAGRCSEYPFLDHMKRIAPRVAKKIVRDSIMTTGASWKSEDAGPNRIRRWVMLLSDRELLKLGIDMKKLKPIIVAKLREKAATYEACMDVAMKLTWLAYGMPSCPPPSESCGKYLQATLGSVMPGMTTCLICRDAIDFGDFAKAQRGKALIETCHANPRVHAADNVGFAHRDCNIAQGSKTTEEFYGWIEGILKRVDGI